MPTALLSIHRTQSAKSGIRHILRTLLETRGVRTRTPRLSIRTSTLSWGTLPTDPTIRVFGIRGPPVIIPTRFPLRTSPVWLRKSTGHPAGGSRSVNRDQTSLPGPWRVHAARRDGPARPGRSPDSHRHRPDPPEPPRIAPPRP